MAVIVIVWILRASLIVVLPTHAFLSQNLGAAGMSSSWKTLPRLVLLDLDGVINQDVGALGVISASKLKLTPGAADAIADLRQAGCSIVIVANQSCVGKGIITESKLSQIQTTIQQMLINQNPLPTIDKIYQCTSTYEHNDPRMKPKPGMILEATTDFSVTAADCCFVGNKSTDLQAAAAVDGTL